jgi:hypothetical protein
MEDLRGEDSIAGLCRKESIVQSLYCTWSKEVHAASKAIPSRTKPRRLGLGITMMDLN